MKRGQFWYGDFLVAVLILMIIGVLFVTSITDITSRNEILKELILEASDISSTLMSEGNNIEGWDDEPPQGTAGFITSNNFDADKFEVFAQLSNANQRVMLGTRNNVWIYLSDREGDIKKESSNGEYSSLGDITSKNLVHIKRFVFYDEDEAGPVKGDIYTLGVVLWQ